MGRLASLSLVVLSLSEANWLVERWHRHHGTAVGHRFAIGARRGASLVGAVIVGRPVSREIDHRQVAEVTRLVTDGTPNACSFLYAAAARAAAAMGYRRIQTYILDSERGTSLRAAGWRLLRRTQGGNWNYSWRIGRREDQPMGKKQCWGKDFGEGPAAGPLELTGLADEDAEDGQLALWTAESPAAPGVL